MRYLALASDYDGTIARHGQVDQSTLDPLRRLRESGRRLLLVTGRELPDLQNVFPELDVFHQVVAENGAVLFNPRTREEKCIAEAPPEAFLAALKRRGVPFSVGRSIVATVRPHEAAVLDVIQELGLELHVIFNKGAVMVLPSGMNKGVGLKAALREMGLSAHNVAGVGDAENDHAFLSMCECGAATANAIATLKDRADVVLSQGWGAGVTELIDAIVKDDLRDVMKGVERHKVLLGTLQSKSVREATPGSSEGKADKSKKAGAQTAEQQEPVCMEPYGSIVLVAGPSGGGKSSAVSGFLERLQEAGYQFCLMDPEGDYENFPDSVTLGNAQHAPTATEALEMLDKFTNTVVNMLGIKLGDRPQFFARLLPKLQESWVRTGRPHWLVVDEAHHLLPVESSPGADEAPWLKSAGGAVLITVHPEMVSRAVLREVNVLLAVGRDPGKTLKDFGRAAGVKVGKAPENELASGEVLLWVRENGGIRKVRVEPAKAERLRHRRKYAEGDVHEKSFYFRGPEGRLKLRAQNLAVFVQMAEGVDDETWGYHLSHRDYSHWVREAIKDPDLAGEIEQIESEESDPAESRRRIFEAIEQRYTGAA